eukprot:3357451-Lingulodinium_polyedra.AAC.1
MATARGCRPCPRTSRRGHRGTQPTAATRTAAGCTRAWAVASRGMASGAAPLALASCSSSACGASHH